MAKPPPGPRDAVTVVLPVHNLAARLDQHVGGWSDALGSLGRGHEILLVNDGSTDDTAAAAAKLAARVKHVRVLTHDHRRGFGACLRTAVPEAAHPLLCHAAADYPYTPADLRTLLDRIDTRDEMFGTLPDVVNGCRTGRQAPLPLRFAGRAWRLFCRVVLGLPLDPPPNWLGVRAYLFGHFVRVVFGVPFFDVTSGFRLYRTAFLKRVPIQSDGDFVHVELAAKATFLTCLVDEVPLTPVPPGPPRVPSVWTDLWRVLTNADFGDPMCVRKPKVLPPATPEPESPPTAVEGLSTPP